MEDTNTPGLSPAQIERLALLSEELGEATQTIGKILRFGFDERHPSGGPNNREAAEKELGHVLAAITLLTKAGDLRFLAIAEEGSTKEATVHKYLRHQ